MATKVGEKGQVVPPEHRRSLKGILAGYVQRSLTPEEWPKAREDAWAQAALED